MYACRERGGGQAPESSVNDAQAGLANLTCSQGAACFAQVLQGAAPTAKKRGAPHIVALSQDGELQGGSWAGEAFSSKI